MRLKRPPGGPDTQTDRAVRSVPVEEEDVVGAGQSLQQDLLLRNGVGRVKLHPDELPHVLVHQADPGAVNDVSDVGRDPSKTHTHKKNPL